MTLNEWVQMEQEAIAKIRAGATLEQLWWEYPGLDRFWLRMQWEKYSPHRTRPKVRMAPARGLTGVQPKRAVTGRRK